MAILELLEVSKRFGGLQAVNRCSFAVEERTITGLIGPNGAGKTTLFNLISGVLRPDRGRILFQGEEIQGLKPHQIARRGLGRTFQLSRIFPKLTLWENLMVVTEDAPRARALLELAGLWPLRDHYAYELSFGQQKLLDLVRVMMLEPRLVLLDEPAAGINPTMRNRILEVIHLLNAQGTTFLIIEHDMDVIMEHCHWVIALNFGEVIAQGPPEAVRTDEEVLRAYFGG